MLKGPIYILENNATIQSLVGEKEREGATGYKVYPVVAPLTEKAPYIAVRQIAGVPQCKGSTSQTIQFVVASYATSYDNVVAIDNAVISCLIASPAGTYSGVSLSSFMSVNLSVDEFVKDSGGLYAKLSTFQVNAE